jgi:hypothetical protein
MTTEIKVWGKGCTGLWSPGRLIDIPDDYIEIKPGDAYVTRHVKLRSAVIYLRMKKSKRRQISELVGILAPRNVIEEVLADAEQSKSARQAHNAKSAVYRTKKETALNQERVEMLRAMLPSIPEDDAESIVEHAFEVGSGRVGRTSALDDKEKLHAATIAHIRHRYTDYDEIMNGGMDRDTARECVAGDIQRVHAKWASPAATEPACQRETGASE